MKIIEPEIARNTSTVYGNADSGSSDGNGVNNDHNNHTENPSRTITNRSESSSHGDSNSWGAGRGSTVHIQQQAEQGEISRSYLPRQRVWNRDHPFELIIGDPDTGVRTRHATQNVCHFSGFLSEMEPKKVDEALEYLDWVIAMQEELNQFERQKVWKLVPRPKNKSVIGTKWVFANKLDEDGIITRNKARLVAKSYSQRRWYRL